eukprot:gene293-3859_t
MPETVPKLMRDKGRFKVLETVERGLERLQACMVLFAARMYEMQKNDGGLGLRPDTGLTCRRCGTEADNKTFLLDDGTCYECAMILKEVTFPQAASDWSCPLCQQTVMVGQSCETCADAWDDPEVATMKDADDANMDDDEDMGMALCHKCGCPDAECECCVPEVPFVARPPGDCPWCHCDYRVCGCFDDLQDDETASGTRGDKNATHERMSIVVQRLLQRSGKPYGLVVREYLAADRDEEATLIALGVRPAMLRERVPSPEASRVVTFSRKRRALADRMRELLEESAGVEQRRAEWFHSMR